MRLCAARWLGAWWARCQLECGNRKCSVLCRHKNSCYNLPQPIVRFGSWLSVIGRKLAEKVVQHRVMQTCIASADFLNVLLDCLDIKNPKVTNIVCNVHNMKAGDSVQVMMMVILPPCTALHWPFVRLIIWKIQH